MIPLYVNSLWSQFMLMMCGCFLTSLLNSVPETQPGTAQSCGVYLGGLCPHLHKHTLKAYLREF